MSAGPDLTPIRIGLVGAGPWAKLFHAPIFASNPATTLAGVWSRRPVASEEIASAHGATSFGSIEEMLLHVDALSFAVPPDIQAEIAIVGALAGKALLLEKPVALDLGLAKELARVVDETGVPTQMVLTWRYAPTVRAFLDAVHHCEPLGGNGQFLTGGLLGGMFATPWRIDRGPLWDLGPHVIDLLDAALGPIDEIAAHGDLYRWVDLQLTHASGIVSQASLTAYSRLEPARAGAAIYHPDGVHEVDTNGVAAAAAPNIASEFAETVGNHRSHALDVHRGLYLQELLTSASLDLDKRR
ncbi:MAG TPA: Gfo/Idh/MocA family oxidoreductase [Acidimicrobiales bacterium]|nr:Gfo/Idh/MocA family oxidoreductase [Acidimicrobiales bacterium]